MQKAEVFYNNILSGCLTKSGGKYYFEYAEEYLKDDKYPSISLSLPKQKDIFISDTLFPFFYGLLAEGDNKEIQCRKLKIDENDHFTRLVKTANFDTIGAITVNEI
jgi:serine/threonine-protein kinase HipA